MMEFPIIYSNRIGECVFIYRYLYLEPDYTHKIYPGGMDPSYEYVIQSLSNGILMTSMGPAPI